MIWHIVLLQSVCASLAGQHMHAIGLPHLEYMPAYSPPIMPGGAAAALRGAAAVHDTGIVTLLRMHMHETFCATLAYAMQGLAWQTQAPKLLICQVVC